MRFDLKKQKDHVLKGLSNKTPDSIQKQSGHIFFCESF